MDIFSQCEHERGNRDDGKTVDKWEFVCETDQRVKIPRINNLVFEFVDKRLIVRWGKQDSMRNAVLVLETTSQHETNEGIYIVMTARFEQSSCVRVNVEETHSPDG